MKGSKKLKSIIVMLLAAFMVAVYIPAWAEAAGEPAVIDRIELKVEVKTDVGEAPAISAECLTEGVTLDTAYLESVIGDFQQEATTQKQFYTDDARNRKLGDNLLTEIEAESEYDFGVILEVKDLSAYTVGRSVVIVCNGEEYTASTREIIKTTDGIIIEMGLFTIDTAEKESFDGWVEDGGYTYYYREGQMVTGFSRIDNNTYYFEFNGVMVTGWQELGENTWYYFGEDGVMADGWQSISDKWYYFRDGVMQNGWQSISNKWYYFRDGVMQNGWQSIRSKWYYFKNGVMQNGWKKIDSDWYYFKNGVMQTGWKKIGNKWYYFLKGVMQDGWRKIFGKWYYFKQGVMVDKWQQIDGGWYYFKGGVMQTGWRNFGGKWYYLQKSGLMATGKLQIGKKVYYFSGSGICKNP